MYNPGGDFEHKLSKSSRRHQLGCTEQHIVFANITITCAQSTYITPSSMKAVLCCFKYPVRYTTVIYA